MTDKKAQRYFTESDVEQIVKGVMNLPIGEVTNRIGNYQAVKAAYTLNLVRILRDRTSLRGLLGQLYATTDIVPAPLRRLIREYVAEEHDEESVKSILEGLQVDIKDYFHRNNIPLVEPDQLPKGSVVKIPGFEKEYEKYINFIKKRLEEVVARTLPESKARQKAQEIWDNAHQNITGELDPVFVVKRLAEVIARKGYLELMMNIGVRDPTKEELANRYFLALEVAFEDLEITGSIERTKILEERMKDTEYQRALKDYRATLDEHTLS